ASHTQLDQSVIASRFTYSSSQPVLLLHPSHTQLDQSVIASPFTYSTRPKCYCFTYSTSPKAASVIASRFTYSTRPKAASVIASRFTYSTSLKAASVIASRFTYSTRPKCYCFTLHILNKTKVVLLHASHTQLDQRQPVL